MEIFNRFDHIQRDLDNVLTVGTFDGLHLGHQFILAELKKSAKAWNGIPTVVTFNPHPQIVLATPDRPAIKILTPTEQKIDLIRRQGIERLIIIPFTKEFSRLTSEEYIRKILYETIGLKGIVIGYDHAFGKGRSGGMHSLQTMAAEKNFIVRQLSPFKIDGKIVSSSLIRNNLLHGNFAEAISCLGHAYTLVGKVIRGDGRGKQLGYPTANIERIHPYQLIPASGVYAVEVRLAGEIFQGMANIGMRPTFNGAHETIEIHLFDFHHSIYEETLEVNFYRRIRHEIKFSSADELKKQLQKDKDVSLRYFRNAMLPSEEQD